MTIPDVTAGHLKGHTRVKNYRVSLSLEAPNYCLCIEDESLPRGPKLLSVYTVEQRELLVRKYWQTGSFKACQTIFRTEFGESVHHQSVASRNWLKS